MKTPLGLGVRSHGGPQGPQAARQAVGPQGVADQIAARDPLCGRCLVQFVLEIRRQADGNAFPHGTPISCARSWQRWMGSSVLARSANGRTEWRDASGVTLKEHQERAAQAASVEVEE